MIIKKCNYKVIQIPYRKKNRMEIIGSSMSAFNAYLVDESKLPDRGTFDIEEYSDEFRKHNLKYYTEFMSRKNYILILENENDKDIKVDLNIKATPLSCRDIFEQLSAFDQGSAFD